MSQVYLYGIIAGAEEGLVAPIGVDGVNPVYKWVNAGIGCVVSNHDGVAFSDLSKEELIRRLFTHQRVVEQVMEHQTVLPVKFGTLLDNSQEALDLLSQGREEFIKALAAIQDKVEIEVAATWDTKRVLKELSKEEKVVRAREAIAGKSRGDSRIAPTLEDQVKLGQLVKACMDQRRDSYRERMVSFLKPFTVEVASNILVSDDMVMNVAFLVERRRQAESDEAVHQLDHLFQDQINFRVIGPLPPYSFSTVVIARIVPEQVQEARQTLGLAELISEATVRGAYRRLAAQEQRNLRQRDGPDTARFNQLRRASEVLLAYLRASQQPPSIPPSQGGNNRGVFLITIKRFEAEDLPHAPAARFEGD